MPLIESHAPGTFCWIELATTDQADAKRFYGALFGWGANDTPVGPDEFYTRFQLGGRIVATAYRMKPGEAAAVPVHWTLYVAVDDAGATAQRAVELGGRLIDAPFDVMDLGRMAVIADPTGAVLAIWQAKRRSGTGMVGERGTMCWADLSSPDPSKAAEFYSALFGWRIAPGENDPSGYLHIWSGAQGIGGIPPAAHRDPKAPAHWMVYFLVEDVDKSTAAASAAGGKTLMPPMAIENVGKMSILADPQGGVFALFREK